MRPRYVHYDLERGFIHNWLVAGPQTIPIELEEIQGYQLKQQLAKRYYQTKSGITQIPVERGPLDKGLFQVGDYSGSWNYYACREDHFVENSGVYPARQYLRSWAYTQLDSKKAQEVLLVLSTHGPADLWLNGLHVQRQEHFFDQNPGSIHCRVPLKAGVNRILVRFEAVAIWECPYAMALRVCKLTDDPISKVEPYQTRDGIRVSIPTLIEALSRRNKFERVAAVTYIAQDVFEGGEQIRLHWPEELEQSSSAVIRLMTPAGQIYAEATVEGTAGDTVFLGLPHQLPAGPYRVFMMPLAWEYYDHDLRITREIPLWNLGRIQYSITPYGTYEERRQEALISAAQSTGLF